MKANEKPCHLLYCTEGIENRKGCPMSRWAVQIAVTCDICGDEEFCNQSTGSRRACRNRPLETRLPLLVEHRQGRSCPRRWTWASTRNARHVKLIPPSASIANLLRPVQFLPEIQPAGRLGGCVYPAWVLGPGSGTLSPAAAPIKALQLSRPESQRVPSRNCPSAKAA